MKSDQSDIKLLSTEHSIPVYNFKSNQGKKPIDVSHVKDYVKFGNDLINFKEVVPFGYWGNFLEEQYGGRNRRIQCLRAMSVARANIPESEHKLGISKLIKIAERKNMETRLPFEKKISMSASKKNQAITEEERSYLEKNIVNVFMHNRLPTGTILNVAKELKTTKHHIKYAISTLKKEKGVPTNIKPTINKVKRKNNNPFYTALREHNIERTMANQNKVSSKKIINALQHRMPKGGSALMIGTPTPFAVSDSKNNNMILTDELEIALAMKETTSVPLTIVLGNLISPEKTEAKAQLWMGNNSTCDCRVIIDRVDGFSFVRYVTKMVEENPLTKVALVTSGVYEGSKYSREKYNEEFNFKTPSKYLTGIYPSLHILVMVLNDGRTFKVLHLHNGNQEFL